MAAERTERRMDGRVSVVIPAYNVAGFIAETIDSVFAQTVQPLEILVVNDGSPDTPALEAALAPYAGRITYLVQENRGLSGARNTGIAAATGEMIALLDGDDLWLPEYLQTQIGFLDEHPEYDLVYCNAIFFGDSIYDGQEYMAVCRSEGEANSTALISRQCHVFVSVTVRSEVLKKVGFDEALRSSEDFDCWLRMTAAGYRIGYHRTVLMRYRKHRTSLSADPTWMANSNLKVLRKAKELWAADSREVRLLDEAIARKAAELETIQGKLALNARNPMLAREHFQRANEFYRSGKMRGVLALLQFVPGLIRGAYVLRARMVRSYRGTN